MKYLLLIIAIFFFACQSTGDPLDRIIAQSNSNFDIWISGGEVYDGISMNPYQADLLIRKDTIAFIGTVDSAKITFTTKIDATGKVVSPGFIDPHAHGNPIYNPSFTNFIAQGVTSISLGQDGSSDLVMNVAGWMDQVEEKPMGVNIIPFVGHGSIRKLAGVNYKQSPSQQDLDKMATILQNALDDGCWGMSTGLEYSPGKFAPEYELIYLAKVVGQYNGVISSHVRNEDDDQIEASLDELLRQGRHCKVHISHFKSVYGKGTARAEQLLAKVDSAREAGIEVTADFYPYTASYTGIGIVFPSWAKAPNNYQTVRRTKRELLAKYLRKRVNRRNGPEATLMGTRPWAGKTLAQLEQEKGKAFEEILIDDIGPSGASAAYFVMDNELQERLIQHPAVMVGSDGSPTMLHPRGYGTQAKIIEEYVGNSELMMLGEAIRKMTSLPAKSYGITYRGILKEGFFADIAIFSPASVQATANFEQPHNLAKGFDFVLLNGKVAWQAGKQVGKSGRVLRKKK